MGRKAPIEVWTEERCFITELLNSPDWPETSVARCRVEPGTTTELHHLAVHEWYVIEQGQALMQVGAETPFEVAPGDIVAIPQQTPQRIRNMGNGDLIFLCVCAPRFTIDCYNSVDNQEEYNDVWPKPNKQ